MGPETSLGYLPARITLDIQCEVQPHVAPSLPHLSGGRELRSRGGGGTSRRVTHGAARSRPIPRERSLKSARDSGSRRGPRGREESRRPRTPLGDVPVDSAARPYPIRHAIVEIAVVELSIVLSSADATRRIK